MEKNKTTCDLVMDNFMYQFGWAMVPTYIVKYYLGYFCEGVSLGGGGVRMTLKHFFINF